MIAGVRLPSTRACRLPSSPLRPRQLVRAMTTSLLSGSTFWLDTFALRQWDDPDFAGTRIAHDKRDFVERVHAFHAEGAQLVDGYAPFCKHVFVPNFVGATVGALAITDGNRHLVQSGYTKRRPEELAVLTR